MKIILVGNSNFTRYILRHIYSKHNHQIVGVVTSENRDRSWYGELEEVCEKEGISLIRTGSITSVTEEISRLNPDIGVCAGWTQIIPEEVLSLPRNGFVGLHASSLPHGRGGAPINWSIIQGQDEVGLSLFEFVEEVDDGDIIAQSEVEIEERDDVKTVYDKITWLASDLLDTSLQKLEAGEGVGQSQDRTEATYRPQRKPDDGIIEWDRSANELHDWIRALTHPYPGAFTFHNEERLTVWKSETVSITDAEADPGEVVESKNNLSISTGDGGIKLRRVQPEGKPEMWGKDYAKRKGIEPGDRIGRIKDIPQDWLYTGIRDVKNGYDFNTNHLVGGVSKINAVHFSRSEIPLKISCSIDGTTTQTVYEVTDGWSSETLKIPLNENGSHTVKVTFSEGEKVVDRRYIVMYATRGVQ
jgi:methionyl-tRNA formyltransferase